MSSKLFKNNQNQNRNDQIKSVIQVEPKVQVNEENMFDSGS